MIIDRQLSALKKLLSQLTWLSLKTKDVLLKTKDSLLKTEDILLKTKDGPSVNRKLLTHILTNIPTNPATHTQTSVLDDYSKLSLWLSLIKIHGIQNA